jgi:hypothetical protein
MRFPYLAHRVGRPVYPLGGALVRHYPVLSVTLTGPAGSYPKDALVDSAADDTIFPLAIAEKVGIDLSGAPTGGAQPVGGGSLVYRYAQVTLGVSDGRETCEWSAIVGFIDLPLRWALLGQTGFLQFLDANLLGAAREVVLTPNANFAGQHTVH